MVKLTLNVLKSPRSLYLKLWKIGTNVCYIVSYISCDRSDTEFASCYPNTVITSHSVYFLFLFHKEIENGEKNTKPDANTQGSLGEFEIT